MMNAQPPSSASREPIDPLVGTALGNCVGPRIGEGGMGVIHRATHLLIGRQAAIKVLSSTHSSNPSVIERFHREARAASRLGHPHIVDVFDFGQTPDGRQYYVMEYLPGENLGQILARRGRLPWRMLQPIVGQTLSALATAHDHGLIHRDIKPENILVSHQPDDTLLVKVVDFGIAKSLELGPEGTKLTAAGSVMGTPEYIAPEQIRDQKIDGRADLYAVGLIIFEALMGHQPFRGPDTTALMLAHLRDPLPPLEPLPAELGVPADLAAVLAQATAKDREARYPDARSFARAIGYEDPAQPQRRSPTPAPSGRGSGASAQPGAAHTGAARRITARRAVVVAAAAGAIAVVATLALRRPPSRNAQPHGGAVGARPHAAPNPTGTAAAVGAPSPADDLVALLVDVRRTLRQGMRAAEAELRRSSVRGLAELRDPDTAALLSAALLDDPEPGVRGAAAWGLAAVGGDDVATTLRTAARQSAGLPRLQILEALWHAGHEEGRRELVQTLGSGAAELRLSAALTLAESGDPRAQPVLRRALAAPGRPRSSGADRGAARAGLARLGPGNAVAAAGGATRRPTAGAARRGRSAGEARAARGRTRAAAPRAATRSGRAADGRAGPDRPRRPARARHAASEPARRDLVDTRAGGTRARRLTAPAAVPALAALLRRRRARRAHGRRRGTGAALRGPTAEPRAPRPAVGPGGPRARGLGDALRGARCRERA
ncbi:MAG: protein kinase [Proteobacteria bacterium]|nr:protein kinase [Pseudomonadota bacterium]